MFNSDLHNGGTALPFEPMKYNWVDVAVKNLGGPQAVADMFGLKRRQTVNAWIRKRSIKHLPFERACEIARESGINLISLTGVTDLPRLIRKKERKMRVGRAEGKHSASEKSDRTNGNSQLD